MVCLGDKMMAIKKSKPGRQVRGLIPVFDTIMKPAIALWVSGGGPSDFLNPFTRSHQSTIKLRPHGRMIEAGRETLHDF